MVLGTVCLFWKVFITLKEIQVPESGKLLLVEPGSWEMFLCGIQNPWPLGIHNTTQGIRNPTNDYYPESNFH